MIHDGNTLLDACVVWYFDVQMSLLARKGFSNWSFVSFQNWKYKKMWSTLRLFAILGLLVTISLGADARRRSKIDSPIQLAAEAPLEDNLATASGSDVVVEKIELPPPKPAEENAPKAAVKIPSVQQCTSDNISFELVTGYDDWNS